MVVVNDLPLILRSETTELASKRLLPMTTRIFNSVQGQVTPKNEISSCTWGKALKRDSMLQDDGAKN